MGEIADALRRFQRPLDEASLARIEKVPRPSSPALPTAAQVLEELRPPNAGIVLQSGSDVEVCRQLGIALVDAMEARGKKSVALVSAIQNEGKTTVFCNLGLALASLSGERRIALLDLDLRRPSLARVLGVDYKVGIEQVLLGRAVLDDVRISVRKPALDLYPAGTAQTASHELLSLPSFAPMLRDLEERYSILLIDTPPVLLVPDASLILRQSVLCVPVARTGRTRARHYRKMIEMLPSRQIIGGILNDASLPRYISEYDYYSDANLPDSGASNSRRALDRERTPYPRGRAEPPLS